MERLKLKLQCALIHSPSKWQRWSLGPGSFAPKASVLFSGDTGSPGSNISPTGETFFSVWCCSSVRFLSCGFRSRLFSHEFISIRSRFLSSWTVTTHRFGGRWIYFHSSTCWETHPDFSGCFCHSPGGHSRVGKGEAAVKVLGSWGAWHRLGCTQECQFSSNHWTFLFSLRSIKMKKFTNSSF